MEAQSLEHVIYASAATQELDAPQLAELLRKSRVANDSAELTGMLLHNDGDGSFFQVLEGAPDSIDRLLQKITVDTRHSKVTVIIREPIAERSFANWSMGFASVSQEKLRTIPELNDFFAEGSCWEDLDSGRAKKLLSAFSEGRWRAKDLGTK